MKHLFLSIAVCAMALLTGCGNAGESSGSSVKTGDGPLALLAEKYVQIGINSDELSKKIEDNKDNGDKINEIAEKMNQKNEVLEEEAKEIAESLKGQAIDCVASEATGLTGAECHIGSVKLLPRKATVILEFKAEQPITQNFGCLFKNNKGDVLNKLRLYIGGDEVPSIIYMFSSNKGGESAITASEISKIEIVSDEEYETAAISATEN